MNLIILASVFLLVSGCTDGKGSSQTPGNPLGKDPKNEPARQFQNVCADVRAKDAEMAAQGFTPMYSVDEITMSVQTDMNTGIVLEGGKVVNQFPAAKSFYCRIEGEALKAGEKYIFKEIVIWFTKELADSAHNEIQLEFGAHQNNKFVYFECRAQGRELNELYDQDLVNSFGDSVKLQFSHSQNQSPLFNLSCLKGLTIQFHQDINIENYQYSAINDGVYIANKPENLPRPYVDVNGGSVRFSIPKDTPMTATRFYTRVLREEESSKTEILTRIGTTEYAYRDADDFRQIDLSTWDSEGDFALLTNELGSVATVKGQ